MKILLLGGGGMLASDIVRSLPAAHAMQALSARQLDITVRADVEAALHSYGPEWIINAAAYTNVDGAEKDPAQADAVNGTALGILGAAALKFDAGIVHFSTDYVFDGRKTTAYDEDDPTSPINAYGASKLLGEHLLAASGARHLILRTQWLFGASGKSFPRTMYERARANEPTRVVNDQFGRPTSASDLATTMWRLLGEQGRYHITNSGGGSWFDFARAVFLHAGTPDVLRSCSTEEYPTPAKRPKNSMLSTDRIGRDHGILMPHWEDALRRFLRDLDPVGT